MSDVMRQLSTAMDRVGRVDAKDIPAGLYDEVKFDVLRVTLSSCFSIGNSLGHPPLISLDIDRVAVADILSDATLHYVRECKSAAGDEREELMKRLDVAWSLLKGFVYGLVNSPYNQALNRHQEIAGKVKTALADGLACLTANQPDGGSMSGDRVTGAIANEPTAGQLDKALQAPLPTEYR